MYFPRKVISIMNFIVIFALFLIDVECSFIHKHLRHFRSLKSNYKKLVGKRHALTSEQAIVDGLQSIFFNGMVEYKPDLYID